MEIVRWMAAAALLIVGHALLAEDARAQPARALEGPDDADDDEPVRVGGVIVPLERLLEHASRNAPAIVVARAEISLADEDFGAADPLLPSNPYVQAQVGPRFGQAGATDLDIQIALTQALEIAGERPLRFDVARAARRTREAELERVRWEVGRQLRAGYRAALVARRRAELARAMARFQADLARAAGRRVEAGEAAPLTVRLAEAQAAQATQRAVVALQRYRSAVLSLAAIAGWDARNPPEPTGELEVRPAPPLGQLVETAREHNPLLAVRRSQLAEARARAALADREAWPHPVIGVQYGREGAPDGGTPEDSVVGVVAVPIPSFQLNQAERAGAEARLEVALAQEAAVLAMLEARLETLRSEAEAARAGIEAYGEEILPRLAENLQWLRRAFEAGEIDLLQLSVAVDRFLQVQVDAMGAYADYFDAAAALENEVGAEVWPR